MSLSCHEQVCLNRDIPSIIGQPNWLCRAFLKQI